MENQKISMQIALHSFVAFQAYYFHSNVAKITSAFHYKKSHKLETNFIHADVDGILEKAINFNLYFHCLMTFIIFIMIAGIKSH